MKAVNSIIALALITAFAAPALAEDIDVKVTGTIAPVACTPLLAGGGVIDYGKISTSLLSSTAYTVLDEKQIDFSITCEAPAKMAIKATNGRLSTTAGVTEGSAGFAAAPVSGFFGTATTGMPVAGLGLASEKKIGGYALRIDPASVTADDTGVALISASGTGAWSKSSFGVLMNPTSVLKTTLAKTGTTVPVAFTTMSGKLGVQAYINKSSALDLTQPITLDGLATIELVYL